MADMARGEAVLDFENRYQCRDGSWKWLSWRSRMDLGTGQVYALARDVTASRAATQEMARVNAELEQRVQARTHSLRESEARFRMLVEGLREHALIMLDTEGRVVSWNEGAARTKRYAAEEVLGRSHACLYPPEAVQAGQPQRDLELAQETGRAEDIGWRVRGDGTRYRAHVIINAVHDENGVLLGFAMITRDITREYETTEKLKRQQSLLAVLMENLAEGVVACDGDEKLTFFNKTAREWHGHDIAEVEPSRWADTFDLFAGDGTTPLALEDIPLVRAARGEQVRGAEMAIVTAGRPPRFIVASGDPLFDEAGQRVGAVVVMHDITERKQTERAALRTQRIESIGLLAGGIAHDLNNALAPVLMAIELLKQRYPQSCELIQAMEVSTRRGAAMVKQLLTFAKGAGGDRVPVKLRHLLNEIEGLIEPTFPKNIRVAIDCPRTLSPIEGDPTQLHQVLLNLCVNARDAMPDGGELTIAVRESTLAAETMPPDVMLEPGDYVEVQVADTGGGIPAEIIDRIFEPFFTTKSVEKGTGLGLATALGIVRSHRGAIRIKSQVGVGTEFFVYLPALAHPVSTETRPPLVDCDVDGTGCLVLFVDDEASIREVGRSVMTGLGFEVITATNGGEAFLVIQERGAELDLVITDKDMPEMNGPTLIRHTRSVAPQAAFVLSSGEIGQVEVDEMKALGVAAILEKPFSQQDLIRVLRHVMAGREEMGYSSPPWN